MQTRSATWAPTEFPPVAARPRLSDRVRARLFAGSLDRRLSEGVPAGRSPALALRARALSRPSMAGELAGQLRRVVRDAHRPAGPSVRVRACREHVLATEQELRLLASRLQASRPVSARAVAKVRVLLSDGTGPLYHRDSVESLGDAIREARSALG